MAARPDRARTITSAGLAGLLRRLDSDPDRAGREYQRLHYGLFKFFDWRGVWPADEAADEVMDRLARKLQDGERVEDVYRYAHGIARLVLLERRRAPAFVPLEAVPELPTTGSSDERARREQFEDCFERCLAETPSDARSILMRYYEGDRSEKISNRRRLALALGLTDNALRSRVQRLRNSLERCIQACVSKVIS